MKFVVISDNELTDYIIKNFESAQNHNLTIDCFATDEPENMSELSYPIIYLHSIQAHDKVLVAVKVNRMLQRLLIFLHEKNVRNIYVITLYALDKRLNFLCGNGIDKKYVHYLDMYDNRPYLVHLETHVCDHCNLNCKACNNFSPFVKEPQKADPIQFENDIKMVASHFSNIGRFFLLGGEPLLESDLCCVMIEIFRRYFPHAELRLLTNAILIPAMTREFWKCLRENDVIIHISLYPPIAPNLTNIEDTLKSNEIHYLIDRIVDVFCKHWTMYPFEDEQFNNTYCGSAGCHYLGNGIMAKCPDAVLIGNMNPELVSNENIYLSKKDEPWEIIKKLETPIDLCCKCTFRRSEVVPWERVGETAEAADWLLENRLEYENRQLFEEIQKLNNQLTEKGNEVSDLQEIMTSLKNDLHKRDSEFLMAKDEIQILNERYNHINSSLSYRIGRGFTFFPRKIRNIAKYLGLNK